MNSQNLTTTTLYENKCGLTFYMSNKTYWLPITTPSCPFCGSSKTTRVVARHEISIVSTHHINPTTA